MPQSQWYILLARIRVHPRLRSIAPVDPRLDSALMNTL